MNATTTRQRLRLGNYEPLLELASGGMATVYVARQQGAAGFERLVVVKRVHRHHLGNREFYRMFLDEARVASLVRHPNVVSVIDTVEQEGELFLVMEYVESTALSSLLKTTVKEGDRIPPAIACRIMADTLAGLHAAHEATDMRGQKLEIVHRDVSPQNIIIGIDGGSRLIDFGVAKAAHRLTETRSGSLKGKLAYMSPEQAMGQPVDRRVDIFAAGVALHESLTGRRLFQGENDLDTMRRNTEMPVKDPSSIAPGVPRSLDPVVQKALIRDPARRFQTAAEFLDALESAIALAPPREVGAYTSMKCGDRLEERRARLKAIAEGQVEPLSLRLVPAADPSNESTVAPLAARRREAETQSESSYSQISHIAASTRDASLPPLKKNRQPLWIALGVTGFIAFAGIVGLGGWYAKHRNDARAAAARAATAQQGATPPPSVTAIKGDDVELSISADSTILGVRAPGTRKLEIVGDHATLTVGPWTGALAIDVIFEGGKVAHLFVDVASPRELRVDPASILAPGTAAVGAGRDKSGDRPGSRKVQPKGQGQPAQPSKPELQDNPY